MNDLSCGIIMWAQVSFVLSRFTRMAAQQTDGRTNGQKGIGNTVRCITCSRRVKTVKHYLYDIYMCVCSY